MNTAAPPDWQRVKLLLARLLEVPAAARAEAIEALSEGDEAMRRELRSLLAAVAQSDDNALRAVAPGFALEALSVRLDAALTRRRIGAWRLLALIAHGGQGEVWRAERADGQFEQVVAIKLLRSGFDREWLATRFAAERQILASLDHPNLARLLDGGTTDDGLPYIVMELVEGEPIDRYCTRLNLLIEQRLALFRTVCQVVGYAHGKGIVHRDLKCDNVLVTADGTVKLVDFGIAKQLDADSRTTATAQRMMTLASSSPEQVKGEHVTPASDVYSLGVLLYRLLTDASPYAGITGEETYGLTRAICETEPPPPSRVDARTSPALSGTQRRRLRGDLDAVVMMALRKDPQHRYANATEFGEDIFRHQESLPVHARKGAVSYRAQRFMLRHRAAVGAIIAVNVALLVGLGLAIRQTAEANQQRLRAERHLATVRGFANVLIFDVSAAIGGLPGATTARKLVVDRALEYLESIAPELLGQPAAQLEMAAAYRRLADIQGAPHQASLGDSRGAARNYQRALDMLATIGPSGLGQSERETLQRERIATGRTLGKLELELGRYEAARPLLLQAEKQALALSAELPDDVDAQAAVVNIYTTLVDVERSDVMSDAILAALERAERAASALSSQHPRNARALRAAALAWSQAGDVHRHRLFLRPERAAASDEAARSLAAFDKGRAALNRAIELDPNNGTNRRDFAMMSGAYASVLHTVRKDDPRAIAVLREGIGTLGALAAADAANPEVVRAQSTLRGMLGSVHKDRDEYTEAAQEFEKAIELIEKSAGREPVETMYRLNLAQGYAELAQVRRTLAKGHARARDGQTACALFARSKDLLSLDTPLPPSHLRIREDVIAALGECKATGG